MQHITVRLLQTFVFSMIAGLSPLCHAAQPTIVSLSPSSGSGTSSTFTLTASDSAGAADIASVNMLINSSFSTQGSCWLSFDHAQQRMFISSGGSWFGGYLVGTTFSTATCTVHFLSYNDSGNNVSFTVDVTFASSWSGPKIIWGEALDKARNDSGYQQVGTFTAVSDNPSQDFTISASPESRTTTPGHSASYAITLQSLNGYSGSLAFSSTVSPATPGVVVYQSFPSGGYTVQVPANGSFTSTVTVNTATDTPVGNIDITITYTDNSLQHSVHVTLNVVPPAAPTLTITPSSGSSSTQTFQITATDPGGYQAVASLNFLINSSLDGRNACWFYYQPDSLQHGTAESGQLTMANDGATDWSKAVGLDANTNAVDPPLQNSQCSVFGGPTRVSGSGDTLTLTITLTFTSSFAGPKSLYVRASDAAGPDSGYQQLGTFTAAGGSGNPDFSVAVGPDSLSVTGAARPTWSVTVTGINGYSGTPNLSVTGLPPNSTLNPPANVPAGQSTNFSVNTTGTTPTGSYPLTVTGTDGTLSHSQTVTLNVQAADVPVLSVSPAQTVGTGQTFTFNATSQNSSSVPFYMNVLIGQTFDGRNACWLYYDGGVLSLASDDASIWQGWNGISPSSIQNSQCSLTSFQANNTATQLSFTVTIAAQSGFTGQKYIYMHAANRQGGDTGYPVEGSWNIQ